MNIDVSVARRSTYSDVEISESAEIRTHCLFDLVVVLDLLCVKTQIFGGLQIGLPQHPLDELVYIAAREVAVEMGG